MRYLLTTQSNGPGEEIEYSPINTLRFDDDLYNLIDSVIGTGYMYLMQFVIHDLHEGVVVFKQEDYTTKDNKYAVKGFAYNIKLEAKKSLEEIREQVPKITAYGSSYTNLNDVTKAIYHFIID